MLKKKKISDDPPTYRLFEHLPTLAPIPLGDIVELRVDLWRWESRWGGNSGELSQEGAIQRLILCASKSDFFRAIKKRGMQS